MCREPRILADDLSRQPLKLGARLQSELRVQRGAGALVQLESFTLPARAVESDHHLRDEALAVMVLVDERTKLTHQVVVASEGEIGIDPLLERTQALLLEACDLGGAGPQERCVGQDLAAPEPERFPREVGSPSMLTFVGCGAGCRKEARRLEDVEQSAAELKSVASAAPSDGRPVRLEKRAKTGDVTLDRVSGRGRRVLTPDVVDQPLDRNDLVRMQEQHGKHGALLRSSKRDRDPVDADLQGPEDEELEPSGHAHTIGV